MEFQLAAGRQILERTPSALDALLGGLADGWLDATEGPDAWSPRQIVAHMLGAERTAWIPRVRLIFESTTPQPLPPFDRTAEIKTSGRQPIGALLESFAEARRESLRALSSFAFDSAALSKRGIHPEFGLVELRQLLATWTVHDLSHLSQIERTLAKQYADAVGPWHVNFRVLR